MLRVTYRNFLDGKIHVLLDDLTEVQAATVVRRAGELGFTEVRVEAQPASSL